MNQIKKSPHYPLLRQSLEYRHCRKAFFVSLVFVVLFTVPTFFLVFSEGDRRGSDPELFFFFLVALAAIGYSIFRGYSWLQIFLHMEDYTFFTATLLKPIVTHSRFHHSVRYSLTFPNMDGTVITRETASMFRNYADPCLEDYNGKQVMMGYNEVTDRLVVIKRAEQ